MFNNPSDELVTSRLTFTEIQSVLMRRLRNGELDLPTIDKVRIHILHEVRQRRIRVLAIRPYHFMLAGRVLTSHGRTSAVRTLDAIQLA
jgi:hypothetical protein